MTNDLKTLAEDANAVAPGDWEWIEQALNSNTMDALWAGDVEVMNFGDDTDYYPTEGDPPDYRVMRFIAAANPTAILALLAELEALRVDAGRMRYLLGKERYQSGDVGLCWFSPAGKHWMYVTDDERGVLETIDAALASAAKVEK